MTNRDMVKKEQAAAPAAATSGAGELSPPVPATENSPTTLSSRDPLDSPQPKPMINQHKSGGLKRPSDGTGGPGRP